MYSEKVRAELLDGTLIDHKNHYAGYCRGFYVTITPQADGYRVTVNAEPSGEIRAIVAAAIKKYSSDKRYRNLSLHGDTDPEE